MDKSIIFLLLTAISLSCTTEPKTFKYTIRGTVVGQESGDFYMSLSRRVGDHVIIPFENYQFEYKGTTPNMFNAFIRLKDYEGGVFSIVTEPGEIVLELHIDSLEHKSKIIEGPYNKAFQIAQNEISALYVEFDYDLPDFKDRVIEWVNNHSKNYRTLEKLLSYENFGNYFPLDVVEEVLDGIDDEKLKDSREYIKLYSIWRSKKDSINVVGNKAMDFKLQNADKKLIRFQSVANNKIIYVEKSGSWCGNSTLKSRELIPIYDRYGEKGFEIITIVPESKIDRWLNWLEKESFPWINLVELDDEIAYKSFSMTDLLFRGYGFSNYLVDMNGNVIANNISSGKLNEILMEQLDPLAYEDYLKEKWELPEDTYILDKESPIHSFDELVYQLSGKPIFIGIWATWCRPCIDEFSFNVELKAFLKSKEIELVHINHDQQLDDNTLLNTIKKYNVQGKHLRANESLRGDLRILQLLESMPSYTIVDSSGRIILKNAFSPSDKEKLYNQIDSAIVKNMI